jgi:diaminopimelate decarboxylase
MQTPYYVIHKEKLDNLMKNLNSALRKYWPNSIVGYSFKTNSLPWIINYMRKAGFFAETVSKDEYQLAKDTAFGNNIIYNGPVKSKETFLEAIKNGCIVNIDSKREVRWLLEANISASIGVRINFDLEKYCPNETQCGSEGGRFGFCYENGEFADVISAFSETKVKIAVVHLHCSSKTRSVGIYKAIANICCEIKEKWNLDLDYIDIGGGFFGGVPGKPDFDEYIKDVSLILQQNFDRDKTKLIVEPGMSLIGAPIDYVTSVIDVKNTSYNRFVVTDGSRTNIDPLMRKHSYSYHIDYCDDKRQKSKKQVISGYTCMENDRLFILEDALELKENDSIIYEKVGAYTMCLTPLFIEYFPDVYLEDNGELTNIRERWTSKKLL